MEEEIMENAEFAFQNVGEKLKAERERRTLTLDDIALRTRIPMRHLEAIEKSEYQKLPGSTYAIGFTRTYARAMEMDDAKIGADLRLELTQSGIGGYQATTPNYEPTDASSVPSRILAWTAAAVGVAIIGAFLIWRGYFMNGDLPSADAATEVVADAEQTAAPTPTAAAAPVNANGEVTLTAKDVVWIKIYDESRKRLFESEMKAGDKYVVPKDAINPMIVTGRPLMLTVSIDGKEVAPLGTAERTIADVGVSAAKLAARTAPQQGAGTAATSGPSASASSAPAIEP